MVNPTDETKKMNEALDEANKHSKKLSGAFMANSKNLAKNISAIGKNTVGVLGLANIMKTLGGVVGNQIKMNDTLAKSLVQAGNATMKVSEVMNSVQGGLVGVEQAIETFGDAVQMGMAGFSDGFLKFSTQLKAQGIDNKGVMTLMRRNIQALGLGEESTLLLADSLVSTAAANKDSINGLVQAINSMKEALTKTSVELGPKAAENAQKIAAMMAQGNTELQGAATKFVTSFLAGSDGFMKAARLGVTFTGQETTAQMAAKFEEILSQIGAIQAGRQGTGSQFFFDAMEKSFKLTREDFLLQQQIGESIDMLVQGNTEERQELLSERSITQAWQNATFEIQSKILGVMQGFAEGLNTLGQKLGGWFVPIVAGTAFMGPTFKALKALGLGFIKFFSFLISTAKASKLGGVGGVAASVLTSTTTEGAVMGSIAGVAAAGAVRKGLGKLMGTKLVGAVTTAIGMTPLGRTAKLISGLVGIAGAVIASKNIDKVFEDPGREGLKAVAKDQLAESSKFAKAFEGILESMSSGVEESNDLLIEQVELARRRTRIVEAQFTGDAGSGPLQEISRFLIQNLAAQQQIIELTEAGNADRNNQRPGTTATNGFNF